jgi:hypothetical protein
MHDQSVKTDKTYPTEEQIEESFRVYKAGGKEAVAEFLKKQREERQRQESTQQPKAAESK